MVLLSNLRQDFLLQKSRIPRSHTVVFEATIEARLRLFIRCGDDSWRNEHADHRWNCFLMDKVVEHDGQFPSGRLAQAILEHQDTVCPGPVISGRLVHPVITYSTWVNLTLPAVWPGNHPLWHTSLNLGIRAELVRFRCSRHRLSKGVNRQRYQNERGAQRIALSVAAARDVHEIAHQDNWIDTQRRVLNSLRHSHASPA